MKPLHGFRLRKFSDILYHSRASSLNVGWAVSTDDNVRFFRFIDTAHLTATNNGAKYKAQNLRKIKSKTPDIVRCVI